jgi:hypothetical protein
VDDLLRILPAQARVAMSLRSGICDLETALSRLDDPATATDAIQAVISALKDIDQRLIALEANASPLR